MARTPFLEAAERCDQLGRTIKERQYGAAGVDAFPVEEVRVEPPEQAWARRFATHVLRPTRSEGVRPPFLQFVAPLAKMPKLPDLPEAAPLPRAQRRVESGHIGSVLGKPGRRRGWWGRLFRGSGN